MLPWAESKNYQKCKEVAMECNGPGFAQHAQGPSSVKNQSINKKIKNADWNICEMRL